MALPLFSQLSNEQDEVYNLPLDDTFLVAGPPGTGKTVMAFHRALRMWEENLAFQVILYNKPVQAYLTREFIEEGIIDEADDHEHWGSTVTGYNKWVPGIYFKMFRKGIPQVEKYVYDWDAVLLRLDKNPASVCDHLIIDEGQDMPPDFFTFAKLLSGGVTVFADENQRIREGQNSDLETIRRKLRVNKEHLFKLTRNYRNTREIAEVAAQFYIGIRTGVPDLPTDRKGRKPEFRCFPNRRTQRDFVATYCKNNSHRRIGILLPSKQVGSWFWSLKDAGSNVQKYEAGEENTLAFDKPGITVQSYYTAKGLEYDTVFLPDLQDHADADFPDAKRMLFYVLTSRARDELYFTAEGLTPPFIRTLLNKSLIHDPTRIERTTE